MSEKKKLPAAAVLTLFLVMVMGLIFVINKLYTRKTAPNPTYLYQIGQGKPWGSLVTPQQVLPYKGKIIVADTGNGRVLAFDIKGKYLFAFEGSPDREKLPVPYPYGLAADGKGNIYVADTEAARIMIYNEKGKFLRYFNPDRKYIAKPTGVYIESDRIFITDVNLNQVHVFNPDGKLLFTIGSGTAGSAEKDLNFPNIVVTDKAGNIYITDNMNNRIQVFNRDGTYKKSIGGEKGLPLTNPRGIALDSAGYIYIANTLNQSVKVLDKEGRFLFDLTGGKNYSFTYPAGISIDREDNIYVCDRSILVFKRG